MDEKPFIGEMYQGVAGAHGIFNSMSDLSTVAETLTVACQRRWCGSLAVQEAANVSTNSSDCRVGFVTGWMRSLFRWRRLLRFRGLLIAGALLRWRQLLLLQWRRLLHATAPVLRAACPVLPTNAALLPPAAGLSTGAALLPAGASLLSVPARLQGASEPGLGRWP